MSSPAPTLPENHNINLLVSWLGQTNENIDQDEGKMTTSKSFYLTIKSYNIIKAYVTVP